MCRHNAHVLKLWRRGEKLNAGGVADQDFVEHGPIQARPIAAHVGQCVLGFKVEQRGQVALARIQVHQEARAASPRQEGRQRLCISDFFRPAGSSATDVIGMHCVTMGPAASEAAQRLFRKNDYTEYLYLHGLSVEMAEAMAEYVHKRIRAELGFAGDDDRDMEKMLSQSYRGSRYSFGYPACPRLEDQVPILSLLGAERIGVDLSDEFQLHPEQSTSAVVVLNPHAKYFSV